MLPISLLTVPFLVCAYLSPVLDNSTPSKAVETFLEAYGRADAAAMRKCLMISTPSDKTDQFIAKRGFGVTISEVKFDEASTADEIARINVTYSFASRAVSETLTENVTCIRQDGEWKVISGEKIIGALAAVAGGNTLALDAFETSRAKAQEASCLSNGKQLVLSVLMYSQDNDEVFPSQSWVQKIEPYHRNDSILACPLDSVGTITYSINTAVAGKSLMKVSKPAETVLLYEGRNGKLSFRHNGKAMIAFADGHCKMVDTKQATRLVWTLNDKPSKGSSSRSEPRPKRR